MLLNGIETALLTQWIDESNIRRMRPDLSEQVEIDRIYSFGVVPEEIVNRRPIGRCVDACLATSPNGKKKSDSSSEDSGTHRRPHSIP